ncbi:MAG: DUF222 domain-containing protein [Gammaproteobacteria bacterium]|nr:DUF222 domain-containing protein [Gammaproteobacteria bacterium]
MTNMPPSSILLFPAMPKSGNENPASYRFAFSIPENDDDLGAEITRLAGHINAAQYRFLKLLAALVERDAWGGDSGMKSPAHWLNYYCGIDLGAAREKVRVAKCLESLPLIDQAFSTGAISYSKVRAMTRTATPDNEDYLLDIARHGTAQHVETLVRKYQRAKRLNAACPDKTQYEAREFSWYYDDDGMLVFKGKLPAEDGALFLKAMDRVLQSIRDEEFQQTEELQLAMDEVEAEEKTFPRKRCEADSGEEADGRLKERAGGLVEVQLEAQLEAPSEERLDNPLQHGHVEYSADAPPPATRETAHKNVSAETFLADVSKPTFTQQQADVLVCMAEYLLATLNQDLSPQPQLTPLTGGDKYQVMVHLDARCHDETETAQYQLDNSCFVAPLATATAQRLACDASLVTVLEDSAGNVLNVGRKTRTVPPAMRRALKLRDQGCRFPGCCESRFIDAHHIQHWCDGGVTSLDNLVLLCRHHHRLLHQEVFSIKSLSIKSPSSKDLSGNGITSNCAATNQKQGEKANSQKLVFINFAGKQIESALFPQFSTEKSNTAQLTNTNTGLPGSSAIELDNASLRLEIDAKTAVSL